MSAVVSYEQCIQIFGTTGRWIHFLRGGHPQALCSEPPCCQTSLPWDRESAVMNTCTCSQEGGHRVRGLTTPMSLSYELHHLLISFFPISFLKWNLIFIAWLLGRKLRLVVISPGPVTILEQPCKIIHPQDSTLALCGQKLRDCSLGLGTSTAPWMILECSQDCEPLI